MPGPKPPKMELTEAERLTLSQVVRRHTAPQQLVARCRIVLAAADGLNNAQIARKEGICVEVASIWRRRWLGFQAIPLEELSVEERLADLPRPGAPARISAEQVCRIIAMACETPEESGRPISQWSQREIADEIMKRGIVEHISPRHAGRFLKRSRSQAASDPVLVDTEGG